MGGWGEGPWALGLGPRCHPSPVRSSEGARVSAGPDVTARCPGPSRGGPCLGCGGGGGAWGFPLVPPRRRGAAPRRLCPRSSCRAARRRSSLRVWWAAGSLGCASAPTPLSTALQARTPCAGVHLARCPTVSYLVDPASSICLSQRLSHACLSTHGRYSETANGSLNQLWFLWSLAPLLLG